MTLTPRCPDCHIPLIHDPTDWWCPQCFVSVFVTLSVEMRRPVTVNTEAPFYGLVKLCERAAKELAESEGDPLKGAA